MDDNRITAENQFRRSGRWLWGLLLTMFPAAIATSKLSDHIHNDLPFSLALTLWMVLLIVVCFWRVIAYWRWTGKYPFYWLRRK